MEFLRHIERCAVIVHVLDCATLEPGRDPLSDLDTIETELAAYAARLATRDPELLRLYPDKTITFCQYLDEKRPFRPMPFVDLEAQQSHLRPRLEEAVHRVLHHGQYIGGREVRLKNI